MGWDVQNDAAKMITKYYIVGLGYTVLNQSNSGESIQVKVYEKSFR